MQDKQKIIKLSILSIIIISLFINIGYLIYEKSYENGDYSGYNQEIINSNLKNVSDDVSVESKYENICSRLKGPFGGLSTYYVLLLSAVLATAISTIFLFFILILYKFKKIVFSSQDMTINICLYFISLFVFVWAFTLELDYGFTYCIRILI